MTTELANSIPARRTSDLWPEDGLGLIDIAKILWIRKRWLLCASLLGGLIAAVVALLIPNRYTATALIMPPEKEQSSASVLIGQLGPLAAVAGADLGLKSPGDLYLGLLGSRTIADNLIRQFGLKAVYRSKTSTEARAKLKGCSRFTSGKDSLIRVEVDDLDPNRAAAMANAYIAELSKQNKTLAVSDAGQRRLFLERQLAEEKAALAAAEDALKTTQERTGVIDVSGQTQLAIASLAQLRAQITSGEVALERVKMGATPNNPVVLQTEQELNALRAQLRKLNESSGRDGSLVPASAMPGAGLNFIRRLRDLKYHEFLFELLSKQYEAARLDENKAAPDIQIVDAAVPPDKKSGPPRSIIVLFGAFVAMLLTGIFVRVQYTRGLSPTAPSR